MYRGVPHQTSHAAPPKPGEPQEASIEPYTGKVSVPTRNKIARATEIPVKIGGAVQRLFDMGAVIAPAVESATVKRLQGRGGPNPIQAAGKALKVVSEGGSVPPNVLRVGAEGFGVKRNSLTYKALGIADYLLDWEFNPVNAAIGHGTSAITGKIAKAAKPIIGEALAKGGAKLAERFPTEAGHADVLGGWIGIGKKAAAGRAVRAAERNNIATNLLSAGKVGTKIRNAVVKSSWDDPQQEALETAHRNENHGRSRLADAIDTYLHSPDVGIAQAKRLGVDPNLVKTLGDEARAEADKNLNILLRHNSLRDKKMSGPLHQTTSPERTAFRRGFFHKMMGWTKEQGFPGMHPEAHTPSAEALHPAHTNAPHPPAAPPEAPTAAPHAAPMVTPTAPPAAPPVAPAPAPVVSPIEHVPMPKSQWQVLKEQREAREAAGLPSHLAPAESGFLDAYGKPITSSAKGTKPLGSPPSTAYIKPGEHFSLPAQLAGSKPSYAYGKKWFSLTFSSDLDKAAYIVGQAKPSSADEHYMHLLRAYYPGSSDEEIRAIGQQVRSHIKGLARDAEAGNLEVPKVIGENHPPATVSEKVKPPVIKEKPAPAEKPATKGAKIPAAEELQQRAQRFNAKQSEETAKSTPAPKAVRQLHPEAQAPTERVSTKPIVEPTTLDKLPENVQRMITRLQKTQPAAADRLASKYGVELEGASKRATVAPVETPKPSPPTETPKSLQEAKTAPTAPQGPMAVPKGTRSFQEMLRGVFKVDPEKAENMAATKGITSEELKQIIADTGPPKGMRRGSLSYFASTNDLKSVPKHEHGLVQIEAPAGSDEGRRAIKSAANSQALEVAGTFAKDLGKGEKPKGGWSAVPDEPKYGPLAGKQVPGTVLKAVQGLSKRAVQSEQDEMVRGVKKAIQHLPSEVKRFMLTMNPTGLLTSVGSRLNQAEIGMKTANLGALRLAKPLATAGRDITNWLRKGVDTEAMRTLDEHFPTWRSSVMDQIESGAGGRSAANMAGAGKFVSIGGRRIYVPPEFTNPRDAYKAFMSTGPVAHAVADQVVKLALFEASRGKIGDEAAAQLVKDHLFDYADQPAILEALNRSGLWAFNAYPTKSMASAIRTAIRRPDLLARYPRLRRDIEAENPGSEDDREDRPRYQRGAMTVPIGKGNVVDIGRWFPFTPFLDMMQPTRPDSGGDQRTWSDKLFSIPLAGPAIYALASNRDAGTGRELHEPGSPELSTLGIYPEQWEFAKKNSPTVASLIRYASKIGKSNEGVTDSASEYAVPETRLHSLMKAFGLPVYGPPMTDARKKAMVGTLTDKFKGYGSYVQGIQKGYSSSDNPYTQQPDISSARIIDRGKLAFRMKSASNYSTQIMKAANSYDAKNQLTDDAKRKVKGAYLLYRALGDKITSLTKQSGG
jgi:hypothetical protein